MSDAGAGWSEERVELLKRLWGDGLSASQIAGQLGGGVTRNAVIGKVHRLGLAGRVKPGAPAPVPAPPVAARRPKPEQPVPAPSAAPLPPVLTALNGGAPPVAASPAIPVSQRVTIMELRESMCRWPMGDPTSPEFRFCGARAITGLPYCTHHAQVAYQPATERRRDRRVAGFR
jgi:GcrA cell cycle regulator